MTVRSRTGRRIAGCRVFAARLPRRRAVKSACFRVVVLVAAIAVTGCGGAAATGSAPATARSTVTSTNATLTQAPGATQGNAASPNPTSPFRPTGSMAAARAGQTASLLSTGEVLIAGGGDPEDAAKAELYDPTTGRFSPTGSMITARYGATATVLSTGLVLIVGGWSEDPNAPVLASAELYNPTSGTFAETGSMATPRADQSATLLPNGRVLIAGGQTDTNNVFSALATAELYDPTTGKFRATASMSVARFNHTATLLTNGDVLIAGGGGPTGVGSGSSVGTAPGLASAELYDPAAGTFTATGSMTVARYWHSATLLPNGSVLIAGGGNGTAPLASAELYDPASATFAATAAMATARYLQTATRLADGGVLIAGGYADGVGSLASAELYDPTAAMFSPAGSMRETRFEDTATLLNDGRVLIVAGGSTDESIDDAARLVTAELYQPAG
jgi:large repetitive protein